MPRVQPERDEALVGLLARGVKRSTASAQLGMSTLTIRRRMADPHFRARVTSARSELFDSIGGLLANVGSKAVTTLSRLLESESEGVRLQAATSILSHLIRTREAIDFADRLAKLEEQALEYKREHAQTY